MLDGLMTDGHAYAGFKLLARSTYKLIGWYNKRIEHNKKKKKQTI